MSCTYEGSIDPRTDDMHVVSPGAAGLDVHKMQITAAVRICEAGGGPARVAVREFSALPNGLRAMTDWLLEHSVTVAALESTGVYWKAPLEALEDAGIQPARHHAEHVRQIRGKKRANDSLWLARVCQFGLASPSHVPPRRFRQLRPPGRASSPATDRAPAGTAQRGCAPGTGRCVPP